MLPPETIRSHVFLFHVEHYTTRFLLFLRLQCEVVWLCSVLLAHGTPASIAITHVCTTLL